MQLDLPECSDHRLGRNISGKFRMTLPRERFCAGLLTFHKNVGGDLTNRFGDKTEVSNSDQLCLRVLSDHAGRDEHFFSLFQVL